MHDPIEKKRFHDAIVAAGFAAPVCAANGEFLYPDDRKAYAAWTIAKRQAAQARRRTKGEQAA